MSEQIKFDEVKDLYKIRNLSLSYLGRREIELAENEMPGLMACRSEYKLQQPLKGARISGSLYLTIQTAVLIETLKVLGADIRQCSSDIFSTQDHAAAAIVANKSAAAFAWKSESLSEYQQCIEKVLTQPNCEGPQLIVDDASDATLLIHEGVKAEKAYAKDKSCLPDPNSTDNAELKCVYKILQRTLKENPFKWTNMVNGCFGVSEETTTGVNRLKQMAKQGTLPFPAISVNDSVTKTKFDNIYGCRHSLPDGIMRATDVMIAGKIVLVCGYGDVGKGCTSSIKNCGARVLVTEIDPICALQACMEGFEVVLLEEVIHNVDIVVTATGNRDILMANNIHRMKNNAIICNVGHFDNEIDMEGLQNQPEIKHKKIKPQVDRFEFKEGHGVLVLAQGRLVNLGCATGHPSFVMSNSFTNQVLAQIELWTERNSGKYTCDDVCVLPKKLDEKVAELHLAKLGAKLTKLNSKQADYIGVKVDGPFKPEHYRY